MYSLNAGTGVTRRVRPKDLVFDRPLDLVELTVSEKISYAFQSAAAFNATSRSVCYRLIHAFRRGTRANRCIGCQ